MQTLMREVAPAVKKISQSTATDIKRIANYLGIMSSNFTVCCETLDAVYREYFIKLPKVEDTSQLDKVINDQREAMLAKFGSHIEEMIVEFNKMLTRLKRECTAPSLKEAKPLIQKQRDLVGKMDGDGNGVCPRASRFAWELKNLTGHINFVKKKFSKLVTSRSSSKLDAVIDRKSKYETGSRYASVIDSDDDSRYESEHGSGSRSRTDGVRRSESMRNPERRSSHHGGHHAGSRDSRRGSESMSLHGSEVTYKPKHYGSVMESKAASFRGSEFGDGTATMRGSVSQTAREKNPAPKGKHKHKKSSHETESVSVYGSEYKGQPKGRAHKH